MKQIYTYMLKDELRDIFKIGTTTDPIGRFKEVCLRKEIVPYMLVKEDREKELHKKHKDMRITHPEQVSGRTEYFKRGGSFIPVAEWVDRQDPLPYISPVEMINDLEKAGTLLYDSITVSFEIASLKYGTYSLGRSVIKLLGVSNSSAMVLDIGKKIAVSDKLIADIIENFSIRVSFNTPSNVYIKGIDGLRIDVTKKQ